MYIDKNVDWYVDSNVGVEVGIGVNRVLYSDFDYEVRRFDIEGAESELGDKFGYINWQKCW